jgi:hypothetical protein
MMRDGGDNLRDVGPKLFGKDLLQASTTPWYSLAANFVANLAVNLAANLAANVPRSGRPYQEITN